MSLVAHNPALMSRTERERVLRQLAQAYARREEERVEEIAADYGISFGHAEGCDHGYDDFQHIVLECRLHSSGGDHASWYLAYFEN